MTPAAHIATAIDLLEVVWPTLRTPKSAPVDVQIHQYFRKHRFMGSTDRAKVSAFVYLILRHLSQLEWRLRETGVPVHPRLLAIAALLTLQNERAANFNSIFTGGQYAPGKLNATDEKAIAGIIRQGELPNTMPHYAAWSIPEWIAPLFLQEYGEQTGSLLASLNCEAPVDLRVNTLKSTREQVIEALTRDGFSPVPSPLAAHGIRLQKRGAFFNTAAFRNGWFEMQDAGSQLIAEMVGAKPGEKIVDFCAGAGGKTLALAASMHNKGRLYAWDIAEHRMKDLKTRIKRAGVDNTQVQVLVSENDSFIKRHKGEMDKVLVDAPCSGTGTWRRNPDLKWRTTSEGLLELVEVQRRILMSASRLLKKNGRLIYATCSLLKDENEQQVEWFLTTHPQFRVVPLIEIWHKDSPLTGKVLKLTPHQDGTDGFFAAAFERME